MRSYLLLLLTAMFSTQSYANKDEQPPRVGNFAIAASQQPGQFFSFGANIFDKDESQFSLTSTNYRGASQYQVSLTPAYVFGLTDNSSVFVQLPVAMKYKEAEQYSSGMGDSLVQFESAFYNYKNKRYEEQATFISGLLIPTGDLDKSPPTGLGSMGLFIGSTMTRTYIDWLYFTGLGMQLNTEQSDFKPGNQLFYQFGLGKNIFNIGSEWILAWVVELDGQYTQKNEVSDQKDLNSGGNVVTMMPSFFISCKSFAFQTGIGVPVIQALNGNQNKNHFVFAAQLVFSHYP